MQARPQVSLIGAPTDIGAGHRGASMGPEALRVAGISEALSQRGIHVVDRGNLSGPLNPWTGPSEGYRHLAEVVAWNRAVMQAVGDELRQGHLPVLLGGDHCLAIGSITAVARHCRETNKRLLVLWLNALLILLWTAAMWLAVGRAIARNPWLRALTLLAVLVTSLVVNPWFTLVSTSAGAIIAFGCALSFFNLGAWGALYAVTPEIYPTSLRGTGAGSAATIGRLAAIVAPLMVPVLLTAGGSALTFAVFGAFFAIACVAAWGLVDLTGVALDDR